MAAKGTRVTDAEKEKMWRLYQELGSMEKVAKRMRRGRSTVSKYIAEYQAAVRAAGYVMNAECHVSKKRIEVLL